MAFFIPLHRLHGNPRLPKPSLVALRFNSNCWKPSTYSSGWTPLATCLIVVLSSTSAAIWNNDSDEQSFISLHPALLFDATSGGSTLIRFDFDFYFAMLSFFRLHCAAEQKFP